MKSLLSTLYSKARLLGFVLLSSAALSLVPEAKAVLITATGTPRPLTNLAPTFTIFNSNTWPKTEANPWFASFTFPNYNLLPSLQGLSFTVEFTNLDTDLTGFDASKISLAIGTSNLSTTSLLQPLSTVDTGLYFNGFGNGTDSRVIFGNPDTAGNASTIYNLLQANSGTLYLALYDRTSSPSNPFFYDPGSLSFTMTLADVPIPFTPTQSVGLGLIALVLGLRHRRQLKQLVLAKA